MLAHTSHIHTRKHNEPKFNCRNLKVAAEGVKSRPSLPLPPGDSLSVSPPPVCSRTNGVRVCCRASSQPSGILTSQLKPTNGLVSGAGLELTTPPLSTAQLGPQDIGLFINQHVGYAQPVATTAGQNLQIVKREPEDLSHHRRLEANSPDLEVASGGIIVGTRQRPKVNYVVLLSSSMCHHSCNSVLVLIFFCLCAQKLPKRLIIFWPFSVFFLV